MLASFAAAWALSQAAPALDAEATIAQCAALRSNERIACLEAALRRQAGAAPAPAPRTAAAETREAMGEPAAAPRAEADGLGAEQVRMRRVREGSEAERRAVEARIIDHAYTALGALVVVLDNGQAWRQGRSDGTEIRLEDGAPYTVRIEAGLLSGYRMRIHEIERIITVERLR